MPGNKRQYGTTTDEGITIDPTLKMVMLTRCIHCAGSGSASNGPGFPGSPNACQFCNGDGELIYGKIYEVV